MIKLDEVMEKIKIESDYEIKKLEDKNSDLEIKLQNAEIFVKK